MRTIVLGVVAVMALAACARPSPSPVASVPASAVASGPPSASAEPLVASQSPSAPPPSEAPAPIPRCARGAGTAFPGGLEHSRDGWSYIGEIAAIPHFPKTFGTVYGPVGAPVPPNEGPGRIVLYETMPGNGGYLKSRTERSAKHNGKAIAVAVCGEPTKVWLDQTTGELVVGWTDRGKSDVLVANAADFTVRELVVSAESVTDCCD